MRSAPDSTPTCAADSTPTCAPDSFGASGIALDSGGVLAIGIGAAADFFCAAKAAEGASPRTDEWYRELILGQGLLVGRCAVELLMRRAGIAGVSGRPRFRRIPNVATASDLVERRFWRDEPDRLWVTDITEHPTREGKVYCAVVLDVFSRRVVGWSIDASPTAALNGRPRKTLGWKTPAEVLDEHLAAAV